MLLDRVVDIRSAKADDPDGSVTESAYTVAFREAGLDLAVLTPAEAGARIKARTPAVAMAVAASLDDWAAVRRGLRGDTPGARRLTEMAWAADADLWRNDFRAAARCSRPVEATGGVAIADKEQQELDELDAVSLDLLGKALDDAGDAAAAEAVLRTAQHRYPGDVWVNYDLARALAKLSRREDAIRYYTAARAIRPETAHELAHALEAKGEWDEAIAVFRDLVERRRENGRHLVCLGRSLKSRGQGAEAAAVLDRAEAAMRSRIRLRPDDPGSHHILGRASWTGQGKLTEAIAEYREAIRLRPNLVEPHTNLGAALYGRGKLAEAIEEYREAIRLLPDAIPHTNLGDALQRQGKLTEAIAEYRQAIRLRPDYAEAHTNLGSASPVAQGKPGEAIVEYREAIRLRPDLAEARTCLGNALLAQGKSAEAIVEYRAIIRLRPDYAEAHYNLGSVLRDQWKVEEAIAEFRAAIRLRPELAEAHCNLGEQLYRQGHFQESLAEYRKGHELGSKRSDWRFPSAQWVRQAERMASLETRLPAVLRGVEKPKNAAEYIAFACVASRTKRYNSSSQLFAEAMRADPRVAEDMRSGHRYNAACAAALAGAGRGEDRPLPDDVEKARWRKQALAWLEADLTAWANLLEAAKPEARGSMVRTLAHWKEDADLASLRDPGALAGLPAEEQPASRKLWVEVDALLEKARGRTP